MLVPFVNHGKQQENAGYTQQRVGKGGTKLAPSPDSPWFLLSLEFIHMLQLPSCVQKIEVNRSLTCWPLNAIGVDLNSQNQQKGAGVHRLAVLVHFKCAGERISLRRVRARKVVEPSPSTPPIFAEWSFRHRGRQGRASSAN